jgi:hypothetical protein
MELLLCTILPYIQLTTPGARVDEQTTAQQIITGTVVSLSVLPAVGFVAWMFARSKNAKTHETAEVRPFAGVGWSLLAYLWMLSYWN